MEQVIVKTGWKIAFAVAGILFAVGLLKYLVQGPPGEAVILRAPPTPLPVQVHVSGSVLAAGVHTLPAGSRVVDAVMAAGGLSPEANPEGLNLAAYLEDGEQIFVPSIAAEIEVSKGVSLEIHSSSKSEDGSDLINLNTASQQDLETLPGIGPVLAQEIITYRESNGPFLNIEDVLLVKGIGDVKYDQIRELITVGDLP
jgi:competence protein ComEA